MNLEVPPGAPLPKAGVPNNSMPILQVMFESTLTLKRRSLAIAVTLALHVALLAVWQMSRRTSVDTPPQPYRPIELLIIPAKPAKTVAITQVEKKPAPAAAIAVNRQTPPPAPQAITPRAATPPASDPEPVVAQAPLQPSKSAAEIMQQARRDVGKIDKDLRKAYPGAPIVAPPDSPQIRLAKGVQLAHDMAPPGLFEAPKVTEIIDPGPYGRRRYRVITALGTYCLTHESNHSPDGQDVFTANRLPKKTNCEPAEQPATKQDWNKRPL